MSKRKRTAFQLIPRARKAQLTRAGQDRGMWLSEVLVDRKLGAIILTVPTKYFSTKAQLSRHITQLFRYGKHLA